MKKDENSTMQQSQPSGQLKLWAIILLSAAPIVVAAYMYFGNVWVPAGTTNKGSFIIPPVSSELINVDKIHTEEPGFQQLDGHRKWIILLLADSVCDQRCERSLYMSRQVNTALGKDANRVGRLLLQTKQDSKLNSLLGEHPQLIVRQISQNQVEDLIEAVAMHDLLLDSFDMLLIDPLGNIMMHYKSEQDGKDLLEDLKRLLKVSKIG